MGRFLALSFLVAAAIMSASYWAFAEENAPGQMTSPTGIKITGSGQKGQSPVLVRSTANGEMLLTFNYWTGTGSPPKDPYFAISTNGGGNWSAPAPIATTAGDLFSLDVIYDGTTAHAVWVEIASAKYQVLYSKKAGASWSSPVALSSQLDLPINQVVIARTGSQKLIVLWDKNVISSPPQMFQAQTTNGGSSWTAENKAFDLSAPILAMAIEADSTGNLHLAIERQAAGVSGSEIYYRKRSAGVWKPEILLSSSEPLKSDSYVPELIATGDKINVIFTYRPTQFDQEIYLMTCSLAADCTAGGQWSNSENISGQSVSANAQDPFFLYPSLLLKDGNLILLYHGIASSQTEQNEVLWINSDICGPWSRTNPVGFTSEAIRALNPSSTLDGDMVGIGYETGGDNQIYYMEIMPGCRINLPAIMR